MMRGREGPGWCDTPGFPGCRAYIAVNLCIIVINLKNNIEGVGRKGEGLIKYSKVSWRSRERCVVSIINFESSF